MNDPLKRGWRKLRDSQPFNAITTRLARGLLPEGSLKHTLSERLPYIGQISFKLPDGQTLKLRSYGDDYLANQIFWTGRYEPELSTLFFALARRAYCTIDIGAHIGFYALVAGYANSANQVYAFEPLKLAYQRLEENIRMNARTNVHPILGAAGALSGSIEFFHAASPYLPSNSSTRRQTFEDSKQDYLTTKVPVVTLDDFCRDKKLATVDLLKMDTEGTEADVLKGAVNLLERDHPLIVCEVLEKVADIPALEYVLRPLGYKFYLLEESGPVLKDRIVGHPTWWNYLFTTLNPDALAKWISGTPGSAGQ